MPIVFTPYPLPVHVEGLGPAYIIYIKDNMMNENDEACVALMDGGQWRHVTTDRIKSWNNTTYGIEKAPPKKEGP